MKKVILIFLSLILVFTSCQDRPASVRLGKDNKDIQVNENLLDNNWQNDSSGRFSYIKYKPQGENKPYIDKEVAFSDSNFLYTNDSPGNTLYGLIDSNFDKVTDLISTEPILFVNDVAKIHCEDGFYYINEYYDVLETFYPGLIYTGNTLIEIDSENEITPYSYKLSDIDPEKYLVPATFYLKDETDYLVGFTTLENIISGKQLKEKDFLIAPLFEEARLFHDGFAAVKIDGKWGYIDESGGIVIDCEFTEVNDFGNGAAGVFKDIIPGRTRPISNMDWGIINTEGELICPYIYPEIGVFIDGIAIARLEYRNIGNMQTYINIYGDNLLKKIPSVYDLTYFSEGFGVIYTGTTCFYVNSNAEKVFDINYTSAKNFSDGLAAYKVDRNGLYGYIDYNGITYIEEKYLYAGDFVDGYAYVFDKETKSGYLIDKNENKYLEELNLTAMSKFNEEGFALGQTKDYSTEETDDYIYYMIKIN